MVFGETLHFSVMGMKTVLFHLSLKVAVCIVNTVTVLFFQSLLNKFDKSFCWKLRERILLVFMIMRTKQ